MSLTANNVLEDDPGGDVDRELLKESLGPPEHHEELDEDVYGHEGDWMDTHSEAAQDQLPCSTPQDSGDDQTESATDDTTPCPVSSQELLQKARVLGLAHTDVSNIMAEAEETNSKAETTQHTTLVDEYSDNPKLLIDRVISVSARRFFGRSPTKSERDAFRVAKRKAMRKMRVQALENRLFIAVNERQVDKAIHRRIQAEMRTDLLRMEVRAVTAGTAEAVGAEAARTEKAIHRRVQAELRRDSLKMEIRAVTAEARAVKAEAVAAEAVRIAAVAEVANRRRALRNQLGEMGLELMRIQAVNFVVQVALGYVGGKLVSMADRQLGRGVAALLRR